MESLYSILVVVGSNMQQASQPDRCFQLGFLVDLAERETKLFRTATSHQCLMGKSTINHHFPL
jgi:hypothetical protein